MEQLTDNFFNRIAPFITAIILITMLVIGLLEWQTAKMKKINDEAKTLQQHLLEQQELIEAGSL